MTLSNHLPLNYKLLYLAIAVILTLTLISCGSEETPESQDISNESHAVAQTDTNTKSLSFEIGQELESKRDRFALLVLSNGNLIAAGGKEVGMQAQSGNFNRTVEIFDPIKNQWTFTGEMKEERMSPVLFELPDGNVMVIGGLSGARDPLISTEILDSNTGTFSMGPEMIRPHNEMGAVTLNDGRFMVIGGSSYDEDIGFQVALSKETEIFDPGSGTWTEAAPMSDKRANHSALVLNDGKVLVLGGGKTDGPYLKSIEIYDPNTDTWKFGADMTKGRVAHTATVLSDGKVLVVGGKGKLTLAEIYDPETDTWALAGETNTSRGDHAALLLADGSVLVTGGIGYLTDAELFDPNTLKWTVVGSLNTGRIRPAVTRLSDGRVLIIAGVGKDGMLASVEVYQD
ncbi:MAG: hypothetical protein CL707_02745 [Chloroflexi bacterium]|nr:hypothetical protein [Chloroflexota bacterium]|tara:strand:+ start:1332 stop:2531 length:1200 start_codon:yes stop_codon:yes gene_type:complete